MDKSTLDYYSSDAENIAIRYESANSPLIQIFTIAFPKEGKILDIGCGSGRDLAELSQQGFNVFGVDPTSQFVNIALQIHPELKGRVTIGSLPEIDIIFGGEFDGILCCAVLMHLEEAMFSKAVLNIKNLLKDKGRLLISLPEKRDDIVINERDEFGRLFKNYSSEFLTIEFEKQGFTLLKKWNNKDSMKRVGIEWLTQLYELSK
jgi:2-polyprenyl-3-methyl-5-hydroxy-6-metoxy-1,4-benzoquinol methylase